MSSNFSARANPKVLLYAAGGTIRLCTSHF